MADLHHLNQIAASLRRRLSELDGVGSGPSGVNRLAWTEEDAGSRRWFSEQAAELAAARGVEIELEVASRSEGREFAPDLRRGLATAAREVVGADAPELICFAGHDAGVLAERLPAAMVLVRNPTGVSHSPREAIDLADAAVAVRVLVALLEAAR